jgi:hypothetical protein
MVDFPASVTEGVRLISDKEEYSWELHRSLFSETEQQIMLENCPIVARRNGTPEAKPEL